MRTVPVTGLMSIWERKQSTECDIRVNACERASIARLHTLNVNVSLALARAIAARPIELSVVVGVEVDDLMGA